MNVFIRVNGKLRQYDVDVACHEKAIAIVSASVVAERFANPHAHAGKAGPALAVIEGIGGA